MKNNIKLLLVILSLFVLSCNSSNQKDKKQNNKSATSDNQKSEEQKSISEKRRLLLSLKGEHSLDGISVNMGANTYVDYVLNKGKWEASGSDWSMRNSEEEPYKIRISGSTRKKLESTKVVVNDDLSIVILCEGKTFFTVPFDENGMSYSFKKSPSSYSLNEALKPNAIIVDSVLYLLGKDKVSHKDVSFTDYVGIDVDIVLLTYDLRRKSFSFETRYEECCDGADFSFH